MGETIVGNLRVFNPGVARGFNGAMVQMAPPWKIEVVSAISKKYFDLGGEGSLLGMPETEELNCPDGVGRFNHFQGGSIYWSPNTGAHVISGAIRDRWAALGWERSYLGYPTSDEVAFDEGGRVNTFQGGQIYWWPDTGSIDLNDVVIHYTGLVCFGETDWDMGSDSDEPYAIFGIVTPQDGYAIRTRVYEDVDDGESRPDLTEVYRGKPGGVVIDTVMMEHDETNPDRYLDVVKAGVGAAAAGVTALVTLIPGVGPILAVGVGPGLAAATPLLAQELNRVFDFGDDKIGTAVLTLSAKSMVLLAARTPNSSFLGIGFKAETSLISGQGASYKAYFGVDPA